MGLIRLANAEEKRETQVGEEERRDPKLSKDGRVGRFRGLEESMLTNKKHIPACVILKNGGFESTEVM